MKKRKFYKMCNGNKMRDRVETLNKILKRKENIHIKFLHKLTQATGLGLFEILKIN